MACSIFSFSSIAHGADQVLAALLTDLVLEVRVQVVDLDRQLAAHVVQQHARHGGALLRRGLGQRGMQLLPHLVHRRQLVEERVLDGQQPGLLEVGRGHAPAALQVPVEAVAEHVAERLLGVLARLEDRVAVAGVGLERQRDRLGHALREVVERESLDARVARRAEEPGAHHPDLDEVVEVPRLQRGVLAVVGEAQELAGGRASGRRPPAGCARCPG